MSTGYQDIRSAVVYLLIMLATFFPCQAIVILIHEFTHSITAFLLGVMPQPFSIVWGNLFTMTCWDEGVQYSRLWATGFGGTVDGWDETFIGILASNITSTPTTTGGWVTAVIILQHHPFPSMLTMQLH
ncbi:MAG: hypothetical protein M0Q92_10065 [Methanoregula sp.]|nr:hypothetical protein [Methanoregula sp.]